MNIDKMEGRELDAKIAELMGIKVIKIANYAKFKEAPLTHYWVRGDNGFFPPAYSRDIAAAYQMEERIAELGLIEEYCFQLNAIANEHKDRDYCRQPQRWQLIHATPEDRCRAALKAMEK